MVYEDDLCEFVLDTVLEDLDQREKQSSGSGAGRGNTADWSEGDGTAGGSSGSNNWNSWGGSASAKDWQAKSLPRASPSTESTGTGSNPGGGAGPAGPQDGAGGAEALVLRADPGRRPCLPERYRGAQTGGIFVTFNSRGGRSASGADYELRGCIGILDPIAMDPGLRDYTRKAAFGDSRFPPITRAELPDIECRVSVLHSYEDQAPGDLLDCWEIDAHGLILKFPVKPATGSPPNPFGNAAERSYSATYLPEIPGEHNMTKASAIESLARKAGWHGNLSQKGARERMQLTTYKSTQVILTWQQFCERRGAQL